MYESFIQQLKEQGAEHLLVYSLEEAENSEQLYLIVLIPNKQTGWFDLHLTAKINGVFGEYARWKERQFQQKPSLLELAYFYIKKAYIQGNVSKQLHATNPFLGFFPYEEQQNPPR